MQQNKKTIWLCDLTHTYQSIVIRQMPLGVGLIASLCQKELEDYVSIRLFKFVDQLVEELEKEPEPFIVGLSNFAWNQNLNLEVSRRIKARFPKVAIVLGGHNFPLEEEQRLSFFKTFPWVDFYIPYEGERAFVNLVTLLMEHGGDIQKVKQAIPANTVFLSGNKLIAGEVTPRINIAEIPSPYLEGFFDEYFNRLNPLVQIVRGCPFSCAFCSEGGMYWNKVSRRNEKVLAEELEYIAHHCEKSRVLYISDTNFAMYPEDIEYCKVIAKLQDRYSWPWQIDVSTAKNKKERVLEAANITRDALSIGASVQSTDPGVLQNVKRENVSLETIRSLLKDSKSDQASVCEVILALPGDSLETHFKTLSDVIDSNLGYIIPLQLMLLPACELASSKSRKENGVQTKFRVVAHCFGRYPWLSGEEDIITAEVEEICIASNTLSFEDYLECRALHLTIAVFYNDHLLDGFLAILNHLGLPVFEFLRSVYQKALQTELKKVYSDFIQETKGELWDSPENLLQFIQSPSIIEKYRQGEYGSNVISKYRTMAIVRYTDLVIDIATKELKKVIHKNKTNIPWIFDFIDEVKRFMTYKLTDVLNTSISFEDNFDYDITDFLDKKIPLEKAIESKQYLRFEHSSSQKKLIEENKILFGEDLSGFSKMFSQVPLSKLLRVAQVNSHSPATFG